MNAPVTAPILLTGFGPFGDNAVNPTMLLMERMAGVEGVATGVLPVEYGACAEAFAALVDRHRPAAALCFGLSARTDFILIERIAWNRDESDKPDNAGVVRDDVAIVEGGPTAYGAGVPIPPLLQTLARAGLPVSFSDHAGGYVCNHLFYQARHLIETRDLDLPMAFLHVPPLPEQVADQPGRRGLPIDSLVLAARTAVAMLRRGMMGVVA